MPVGVPRWLPQSTVRHATGTKVPMSFVDLIMTVIQIVILFSVMVVLHRVTPLPFWACAVLSVPMGLAAFWHVLLVLAFRASRHLRRGRDDA